MAATLEQIKSWLARGHEYSATHMIVKCDSIGGDPYDTSCCYPVYVLPGEEPRKKASETGNRTMECYSFSLDIDMQLREARANHWD